MGNPVYVLYNGSRFSVPNRSLEDIQQEILEAMASNTPRWLEVNYGEGRPSPARLLIAPGVAIALQQDAVPSGGVGTKGP